ncbi:dynein heavy chain domain-containing protein 1 [Conger conger]|uniref:dynein heavy chain domain-containing protein 1 n=1 Tax=Conger conger TaxID=82655 RepID=UPI002A5A59CD|nr:dynein heavy chain domain-containing protein 1 [Conger conger]
MVSLPLLAPADLGGRAPHVRPSPAFMQGPQPGRPLSPMRYSPVPPALSTAELPRLVAEVGPHVAVGDCAWMEGPQLMASALGVQIPLSASQLSCEELTVESVTEEEVPEEQKKPMAILNAVGKTETAILNTVRKTELLRLGPLTGMEVADIFMKRKHVGKLQFVHLKAMEGGAYRPYDLRVVPHDRTGPDHYIFSPSSVLHVRDGCSVGFQTLEEWHREALLWTLLRGLPFFRLFRLRRAFTRWRRTVRRALLCRTGSLLQEQLLISVPQFREALLQVSRLIEELKKVHWLPQDDSHTYTLLEFHSALMRQNKESRALLEKFLQYRSLILNMVQEDSYRAQQHFQQQVEQVQVNRPDQPLHLQRAHQQHLHQRQAQAQSALQRLGNMAALVNHMTVQCLATVAHREVAHFLRNVVTRSQPQQGGLFLMELAFGAEAQLALVPPVHLLQEALQGALCSVADSVLQVIDSNLSGSKDSISDAPQDLTSDPTLPSNNEVAGTIDPWAGHVMPRPQSRAKLVLANASTPRVEGQRLKGHYCPLSRPSLERQLSASVGEQAAQADLERVTQGALQEVEGLCDRFSWLGEVHMSCSQWSSASLEAMRGWPSQHYHEHLQRGRDWAERLSTLPVCFTTSNRLVTVRCSHIREDLAPQLASMEEEVLSLLQEEVQRRSEALVSELKTAADWLRAEPADLDGFWQYASRVKRCEGLCADLQTQTQYLQSLQETLSSSSRPLSQNEAVLEALVQDSWKHFLPLLQQAGETVRQHTPSMAVTLDCTASSLTHKLQGLVAQATSGPYTDPSQESAVMVGQLQSIHSQFCTVAAQLEQMREASVVIGDGENPLDISLVVEERQKLEDRRALWELLRVSASYIHEWRQLLFSKEKVDRWLQQAMLLKRTVPPCDMVLKHVLQLLEGFRQQLPLLAKLSSPGLGHKHWGKIFKGMGLVFTPESGMTVAGLLSTNPLDHQNMITKVCQEARAEADMEQAFRKIPQCWEETLFRLANFLLTVWREEEPHREPASGRTTPDSHGAKHHPRARQSRDSGTFIVIGLETLLSQTQGSIMTLSSMLLSPHGVELRPEVEQWLQQLQELEELLDIWKRYQLKWAYLSKMFHEFGVIIQNPEVYQRFLPVDETYREVIQTMLRHPQVLNFLQLGHGQPGLHALLAEGLSTMEGISAQLLDFLDRPRDQFPRLCFLSDGEVMELLSLHPTPTSLLPLVRKCFQGVQELEIAYRVKENPEEEEDLPSTQPWVRGVFGGLGERVPFLCSVEPSLDPLGWLGELEEQLHYAMVQLMADCAIARQRCQSQQGGRKGDTPTKEAVTPPSLWDLISSFPLQCLLVVEEAKWCKEVRQAFLSPVPGKRALLKSHYNTKLQSLCQLIQDVCVGRSERSVGSRRLAASLSAMVLLAIKHSQQLSGLMELKCELESAFEWQSLMKYHLSAYDHSGPVGLTDIAIAGHSMELSCYVEILSSRLAYGYEYLSPEHWTLVNTTSSDRAALGILLALTCYRCGFLSGPRMSGKTKTVVHLGQALGRHVITLRCCPETSAGVVLRMLMGSLQTGAWLLLDSADSMSQGALSLLGQHLSDIHQCFSFLLGCNQQQPGKSEMEHEQRGISRDSSKGSTESVDVPITLGGKTVSAKLGYGCILLSSSRQVLEVPENLRTATRPVSLVKPDYRVIAEATLAASGFSDATAMSRRLVSLFRLAKDSACLPESICAGPASWLVLLNRVLTFAGMRLNQSMRVEWEKDEALAHDQENQRQLLHMVLRAPEGLGDGSKRTRPTKFRRANQCVIVLQAIAEEQAVIKAVTLAVASAIVDPGRACHFHTIFEEIFPGARCPAYRLQGREEKQEAMLKAAVEEELQEAGLNPSPCVLSTALSLYQAMKLSRAVVLLGLTGSGKTACYQGLAGALRKLAGRAAEERSGGGSCEAAKGTGTESLSPAPSWSSVDTAVIFPNALTIGELWGGFCGPQGCWRDGTITEALRESQELSNAESSTTGTSVPNYTPRSRKLVVKLHTVKWLVLDGEPLGQPGWLDPLCTLCDPKDPFLCLPTGEKLRPPCEELKVLIEATALEDASPAAMTQCGLVHHRPAEDRWRSVWKAQLEALNRDPALDHWCLRMWSRLADDLFGRTLSFLRERKLGSVLPEQVAGAEEVIHGVQEVMSFSRVLCALKEQFGRNRLKAASKHTDKKEGTSETPQKMSVALVTPSAQQELQARNVFVVAYIWGFGGHLHPRHWPHFDEFARSTLFESRYRVEVPAEASVFEYFVHLNDGPVETHCGLQNRSVQMPCTTIPQYERYVFLLRLMLKARQPALLVGEVGSGKTTLCNSALGLKLPHLRLPTCALLRAAHLRALLEGVGCQAARLDAMTTVTRKPGLVLFLDDVHDAPCDAFGKVSMALETLRQCLSTGGVLTSAGQHFRLCSSGELSFLASCATPGAAISPRLSRLFSVLVLPGLSADLLFSIHSPRVQLWLTELPCVSDMATCILTATLDLYHAVQRAFPPRLDRPHFLFSPHDLRKVFQGMCLWRSPWGGGDAHCLRASLSSTFTATLGVVRLWAHECLRTFWDRLCSEEERGEVLALLAQVSQKNFASRLASERKMDTKERESNTPDMSAACEPGEGEEERASTREESPTSSLEEEEDEDHTETGELDEGSSCVSVSLSEEEEELSEIPSGEPDMESMNGEAVEGDTGTLSSPETLSETSRAPSALRPSPPKDARPQGKPNRKRSGKLVIQLPQCTSTDQEAQAEQSPVSARLTVEPLQNLGESLLDVVYGPDLSGPLHLQTRLRNFKRCSAYMDQELEALVKQLAAVMKLKEEEEGAEKDRYAASYGLHVQGVRQLAHALRTLIIPGGHGVLFGAAKGTGRKTTVRLAARLMGYRLLELHSGNETTVWETLKEASAHLGVRREGLVLLVHESASQVVQEELLVAMANKTFPRLYTYKEWKIRNLVGSHRHEEDHRTERYFRQVPWNVHVFLLMHLTPGGECPRTGGFIARALSLCSCVEVYQSWTTESLIDVATHHLTSYLQIPNLNTEADRLCLVLSLSQAMAGVHQSAQRYASVLTPDLQPFGPQTFMEFLSHFLYLCAHLYDEGRCQANRVAAILGRMKELTEQAERYSQEVLSLKAELTEAQQRQAQLQRAVEAGRNACERARQHCLLEENRLAELEEELLEARQISQDALELVSPLYQAALEAMQSLSQSDLEELRRYRRPPEGVMVVMDVICLLFGRPCSWESSQQLLGRPNFLQELEFFDRSALSGELFRALREAVGRAGFRPEAVREVSRACESLCRWARAVYQHARARREMAPHEARRALLEAQAAQTRARLRDVRLQEEAARARLGEAERRLQEGRSASEELAARLRQAQARERDAAAAVQRAAPHISDWNALARETERAIGTVPGDALTLAAALAYLGPFGPDVRSELQGKWRALCVTGRIQTDPADPRTVHLSATPCPPPLASPYAPVPLGEDPQAPMARLVGGVEGAGQGVAPALLLNVLLWGYRSPRAQHCPLLADIEQREGIVASPSSGQLSEGKGQNEYDLVVSADDPALLDRLRQGAEKGLTVLVTHAERAQPTPGLLGLLGRRAGLPPAAQRGFTLFLSTSLPVRALLREIHPLILAEVRVVDLSLSGAELQELMQTELMQSKCHRIWSQNCQAREEKQMLLDRLEQEEVSLMDYVLQSSAPLLQDPQFLPRVSACQTTVSGVRRDLLDLDQELEGLRPALACFDREAEPVTAFYQALQGVARLSPLYLFPLRHFLPALREALALQDTPDPMFGGDAGTCTVSGEVLVAHLMVHYRPCLFQSHAGVLRLLVSVAMAHRGGGCSEAERVAFLRGLADENIPVPTQTDPGPTRPAFTPSTPPTQLPTWIPPAVQREVLRLESLPSFRGLVSSLSSCSEQWAEYLRYPSSTVIGPVQCPSHSHLSVLQRALLWKTLLPHWLAAVADDLAACQLGEAFQTALASAPHPGTPEALAQTLDKAKGPVVFILSGPSEAGPPPVHPLHWLEQAARGLEDTTVKKVQVISFGAECLRGVVLKALDLAVQEGHWLVFNNCHLLDQWDEEVECQLTQLVSCTDRAGVRSSALRLACDSPWDLEEALRGSLRQAGSAALSPAGAGPLLRCAALHAVLLRRRRYGNLGQGRVYSWTREDLQALLEAQVWTASRCGDPVGALEYIAGSLVYGGHVEDPADLEAVKGVAKACLRPPPRLWGRGPHTLSELVARGRFGRRALLQDVEQRLQASSPSSDPLLLGLSAGLAGELVRLQSHRLHLLLRDSQTPAVQPCPPALPQLTQARDRLQALKDTLERGGGCRVTPQTPLGLFLQQEWDGLVRRAASLHASLAQPGRNHTPHPSAHTLSRLEVRAELLGAYLRRESPGTPPYAYRLSAFHNPRGFLTALLREAARAEKGDPSGLSLHYQVLSAGMVPSSAPPCGAYLCGLELQGALWDTRLTAVQDTLSPKPCLLPLVWVRAQTRPPEEPGGSSPLPLYRCPLYLDGEFGEGGAVTRVPLAAKLDPVQCALRPVRLVSTLEEGPRP